MIINMSTLRLGFLITIAHTPVACKTSVAKICLHIFMTECSRRRRRRQRGDSPVPIPALHTSNGQPGW